ncbi:formin-like protein 3 [Ailuropoda melanoleuca]|uniref:formin-like protein 3 n=1 Tax=Ailuropoda melanoleuca TaxID=9646 RepID=UPI001494E840|nr:formin-like protein 3 [Ailuropoda melanoleuca]
MLPFPHYAPLSGWLLLRSRSPPCPPQLRPWVKTIRGPGSDPGHPHPDSPPTQPDAAEGRPPPDRGAPFSPSLLFTSSTHFRPGRGFQPLWTLTDKTGQPFMLPKLFPLLEEKPLFLDFRFWPSDPAQEDSLMVPPPLVPGAISQFIIPPLLPPSRSCLLPSSSDLEPCSTPGCWLFGGEST